MSEREFPGWLSGEKARMENMIRLQKLEEVAAELKRELDKQGINDTGRLERGIRVNVVGNRVVMTAPYSMFVEHGRHPGGRLPPYEAIRKWVGHKLGVTGRKQARAVTWAIMRKIANEGIPATHILEKAWRKVTR